MPTPAPSEVTDATFEAEVLDCGRPVVVDFWAPWCRPCEAVEPILCELAAASDGRVRLVRLNIEESQAIGARYGVLSIPTAILFEGGEPRKAVRGVRSRRHYEEAWATWLGPAC